MNHNHINNFWKNKEWLDSDLIPRLLENFENWENVTVSLLNIKNEAYRPKFECVGVF